MSIQLKAGWLKRQFNNVAVEVACLPKSYRDAMQHDDATLTVEQRKEAAGILRARADELDPATLVENACKSCGRDVWLGGVGHGLLCVCGLKQCDVKAVGGANSVVQQEKDAVFNCRHIALQGRPANRYNHPADAWNPQQYFWGMME